MSRDHTVSQIPPDPERGRILTCLKEILKEADFVYVYGSFWGAYFGPESDVDVAVQYPGKLESSEYLDLVSELERNAGRVVDLLDLRRGDTVIAFQVMKTGQLISVKDTKALRSFQMETLTRYQDFKIERRPVERMMVRRATA